MNNKNEIKIVYRLKEKKKNIRILEIDLLKIIKLNVI